MDLDALRRENDALRRQHEAARADLDAARAEQERLDREYEHLERFHKDLNQFREDVERIGRDQPQAEIVAGWVKQLIGYDECEILLAPTPVRGLPYDEYKRAWRDWGRLYEQAKESHSFSQLTDPERQAIWARVAKGEIQAAVEVVYAWIPDRSQGSSLIVAGNRTSRKSLPALNEDSSRMRLAALLIASTRIPLGPPTPFAEHFRRRFVYYQEIEGEFDGLGAKSRQQSAELIEELRAVRPGHDDASRFQKTVDRIFQWVFEPNLVKPRLEHDLHDRAKRIDIVYRNAAERGLFRDLPARHLIACPYIIVECKNYTPDPENPELDQLLGRFGGGRGKIGFLVCRQVQDRSKALLRCREAVRDDRGWMIVFDSDDLTALLRAKALDEQEGAPHDNARVWHILDDHFRLLAF